MLQGLSFSANIQACHFFIRYVNPKMFGGGGGFRGWRGSVVFRKNVSFKESAKTVFFFVTFNIISHILPEKFIQIVQVAQRI